MLKKEEQSREAKPAKPSFCGCAYIDTEKRLPLDEKQMKCGENMT
jgi:hypothetical protein